MNNLLEFSALADNAWRRWWPWRRPRGRRRRLPPVVSGAACPPTSRTTRASATATVSSGPAASAAACARCGQCMLVCAAAVLGPCASQTSQITSLPARAQRFWFGPALPSKPVELVFGEQGTAFLLCFLCRSCLKRCLSSQSYMKSCLKLRKVEVLPIKPKRRRGGAGPCPAAGGVRHAVPDDPRPAGGRDPEPGHVPGALRRGRRAERGTPQDPEDPAKVRSEAVVLLQPPLHLVGVSIRMERVCQPVRCSRWVAPGRRRDCHSADVLSILLALLASSSMYSSTSWSAAKARNSGGRWRYMKRERWA